MAQRICLTAEAGNVGVFLTPAVADTPTCGLLHIERPGDIAIYALTIGAPQ
jgi:hypothetical protein